MIPRGRDLTLNEDPRVGNLTLENLKMSNSPGVARPPPSWGKPLIGALGCKVVRLQGCQVVRLQGCQAVRLLSPQVVRMSG